MNQLAEMLIKEWHNRPLPDIISRDIDLAEYSNLQIRKIVSLVGFRRVGKTYIFLDFAKKIGKADCLYINFEDERIPKKVGFLSDVIDALTEISGIKPYTLLFDEIQNVPDWSIWARRIVETTNHKLFVTGSSSKLTSRELPTELRGRSLTVNIEPLNFSEFLRFKKTDYDLLPVARQQNFLREYITYGGFPEVSLVDEGKKILVINEYYNTFVSRDIIERHRIRNSELLNSLIKLLLNSPFYTISGLTKSLKSMGFDTGKATIARYISYLEESLFLRNLELYTPSVKKRGKAQRKPYFVDNAFLFRFSTEFSDNFGRLMENMVFNRLPNIYYWRNYQEKEIDFVEREREVNNKLIQVSFVNDRSEIKEREIKNLILGSEILKCDDLNLITWSVEGFVEKSGRRIKLIPISKFLI
ncbi:MAG: ATP-binding protein [Patescibacteria group bacterium]